jgi:signal transduction histidine kinase
MNSSLGLLCQPDGLVASVLSDTIGIPSLRAGRLLGDIVHPASRQKARNLLDAALNEGAAFGWEIDLDCAGNLQTLIFHAVATPPGIVLLGTTRAAIDAHAADGLFAIASELATARRQLEKQNAELEGLHREKTRLLGMAAHDLRGPLGVILVYVDILIEDSRLSPEQKSQLLAAIRNSTEFMTRLIDDVLQLSSSDYGALALDLKLADWPSLVSQNVMLNQVLARKKNIRIDFQAESGLPAVPVDAVKIQQVLNNLIGNAIKFSGAGTTVRVSLRANHSGIVLSVKDEGPGIRAEEIGGLFQPFKKTSVRSTGGEPGSGLGLAIVKRIVEAHSGRVWVESEPGAGSTFFCSFPQSAVGGASRGPML